jgi:hypothetical protein
MVTFIGASRVPREPRRGDTDRDRRGRVVGEPHLLDVVEGPYFRAEDVDDHVAGVDQHPVAMRHALDPEIAAAGRFQVIEKAVGDRPDVTLGTPGCDNHVVAERRFSADVD